MEIAEKHEHRDSPFDSTQDAVSQYLKNTRRYPLLDAAAELKIAKKIEAAEQTILKTITHTACAVSHIVKLGQQVAAGLKSPGKMLRYFYRQNAATKNGDKISLLTATINELKRLNLENRLDRRQLRNAAMGSQVPQRILKSISKRNDQMFDLVKNWRLQPSIVGDICEVIHKRMDRFDSMDSTFAPGEDRRSLLKSLSRIKAGRIDADQAKNELVNANLRLVVSIAKRYKNADLQLPDLIQDGNIGLIKAVDRFDYHRGARFSTFATWWIHQSVLRAIQNQAHTIRIPVHVLEQMQKHKRRSVKSSMPNLVDVDSSAVSNRVVMSRYTEFKMLEKMQQTVSLYTPVKGDGMRQVKDYLKDEVSVHPYDAVVQRDLGEHLRKVLALLTPREEKILRMRFGIGESYDHTLEEVSLSFSLTRERIRQIETEALKKLRHPQLFCALKSFL